MEIDKLYSAFKECSGISTDSRSIKGGEFFFALKGETFDGNEYALHALEQGARYAVVNAGTAAASSGKEGIIVVPDTLVTLQELARYHREHISVNGKKLPVLGLTGTNGKTTTKELITKVLSVKYKVISTQGNLNNDIGVPLSVLKIDGSAQMAVIEMGASHPDDIAALVKISEPDYGLITNVGKAHLLGFGSFEGVKKAKGQLYDYVQAHDGTIFINADDPVLMEMAAARRGLKRIEYGIGLWGAIVLPSDASHPFVRIAIPEHPGEAAAEGSSENLLALESHLAGAYNANNIAAAIAVGMHFGVSLEDAVQAVSEYVPVNNRSQMEKTERNILIEDAYNANPTSMTAALDNLSLTVADRKAVLLGDMRELGTESFSEHKAILEKVLSMKLDLVCLVGEEFRKALEAEAGKPSVKWFADSDELAAWLKANPVSGTTVLVKGSRGIRMEKAIPEL